jgi:hypothetical protein
MTLSDYTIMTLFYYDTILFKNASNVSSTLQGVLERMVNFERIYYVSR